MSKYIIILLLYLIILLENVILFRRKTLPFSALEFSIVSTILVIATGNVILSTILFILCIFLVLSRRILFNQRYEFDGISFDFDYSKEIYSISRIFNTFKLLFKF